MTELSPDHRLVKDAVRLHRPDGRREQRAFLVEGLRAIEPFLAAGWEPQAVFARGDVDYPTAWPTPHRVGARAATKLSQATTPSGLVARFALPTPPPLEPAAGGLALTGLSDPGNVGTLLRSAAAFAIADVALIGGVDPYAHKVVQASAGALARLRIHRLPADAGLDGLRCVPAPIAALVVAGGEPPGRWRRQPCWLVVGGEADGIPDGWLAPGDQRWSLPMHPGSESLNAAVAGSIALYLLAQQAMGQPGA
ncbi:MAG TPA: RNA methyltransferase [Planctomycetota bacterium]|nr:RNA methyltransferase [Planctomycetota bacterium]